MNASDGELQRRKRQQKILSAEGASRFDGIVRRRTVGVFSELRDNGIVHEGSRTRENREGHEFYSCRLARQNESGFQPLR